MSAPRGLRHKVSVRGRCCSAVRMDLRAAVALRLLTEWIASPIKTPSFQAADPSRTAQMTGKDPPQEISMPKSPGTFLNLTGTSTYGCAASTCVLRSRLSAKGRSLSFGSSSSRALPTEFVSFKKAMESPERIPRRSASPPGLTEPTTGIGACHSTWNSSRCTVVSKQIRRLNLKLASIVLEPGLNVKLFLGVTSLLGMGSFCWTAIALAASILVSGGKPGFARGELLDSDFVVFVVSANGNLLLLSALGKLEKLLTSVKSRLWVLEMFALGTWLVEREPGREPELEPGCEPEREPGRAPGRRAEPDPWDIASSANMS